jgi:hypothetical protein
VISYIVKQRTAEIGIRLAQRARPAFDADAAADGCRADGGGDGGGGAT